MEFNVLTTNDYRTSIGGIMDSNIARLVRAKARRLGISTDTLLNVLAGKAVVEGDLDDEWEVILAITVNDIDEFFPFESRVES